MVLLVHSQSNEKISSQISIILWFSGPIQYIINVFKNKKIYTEYKKNIKNMFYRKIKKNIK